MKKITLTIVGGKQAKAARTAQLNADNGQITGTDLGKHLAAAEMCEAEFELFLMAKIAKKVSGEITAKRHARTRRRVYRYLLANAE